LTMADEPRLYDDAREVALKDLKLDPDNVRFRHIPKPLSEKEMEDWLYEEEDVRLIIKQIIRDRRIQQPIYVREDKDGKYIVKEGNRRTVALRKINRDILTGKIKGFEKGHFDIVPIMILRGSDHDIDVFLGQIHVSGPKEWRAVNKASVVFNLMNKYGDTLEGVAEELGMTKKQVENYYKAFQTTGVYGKRHPEDRNHVPKFSYFVELYQSKTLTTWAEQDPSRLDYFIELVAKNKLLVTYKGVRSLAKIIAAPNPLQTKALSVLDKEDGDIEKALSVITEYGDASKGIWKNAKKLLTSLKKATYEEFLSAVDDSSKQEVITEIITVASSIQNNIDRLKEKKQK
jgi:predicted transcriptional regulator